METNDEKKTNTHNKGIKIRKRKKICPEEGDKILYYTLKDVPVTQIAEIVDRHVSKVIEYRDRFKLMLDYLASVGEYRKSKTDLLDAAEYLALKSLTDCLARDDGNLQQRAIAFRELYNANRLHHNQSTSNAAHVQTLVIPLDVIDSIGAKKPPTG